MALLSAARADLATLESGEQLGGVGSFVYLEDGNVVVVNPSGASTKLAVQTFISARLEQLGKLQPENGDILHVENIAIERNSVGFASDLFGRKTLPLDVIVTTSPPAGEAIPSVPVQIEQEAPKAPKRSGRHQGPD